ncbi:hypothetical protein, partial [Halostella sp. PRR32]
MREPIAYRSAAIAALVVALAFGAGLSPVDALATDDARAASFSPGVETTTAGEAAPPDARIVARYPAENGSMVERTVVSPADVARVGEPVNDSRTGAWTVAMT